ncbi:helix-turn-helix domain-containing protein [Spirosoma jeollabukense]
METKPRGAPTKYKPEFAEQARKYCLLEGATDEELAANFGVTIRTLDNWKNKYPDFLRGVLEGKKVADANVAEGFYKRAVGYEYTETTFEKVDDKKMLEATPDALITTDAYKKKIVTKHLPPDAGAALNWLKNRQPAKWRDKVEVAHSGKLETSELGALSDAQLAQLLADLETKLNRGNTEP